MSCGGLPDGLRRSAHRSAGSDLRGVRGGRSRPRAWGHGHPPAAAATRPSRTRGRLLALLLFVVAPVCAEYLTAYDPEVTGQAAALVGGLLVLGPLYGAPAILIRELAARTGMHWTGILALAGAFGVLQAGVVDQSLFAMHYLGYDEWADGMALTLVAPARRRRVRSR